MSRRWWIAVLVAGVLAIVAVLVSRQLDRQDRPSKTFCNSFTNISRVVVVYSAELDAVERDPNSDPPTRPIGPAIPLMFGEETAREAPPELRADALVVAAALRRASREDQSAPLHDDQIAAAVKRLDDATGPYCEGVDP